MLMRIREFQKQFTPESRPDQRTVIKWIEDGEIIGTRMGKIWYVDPERSPKTSNLHPLTQKVLTA